MARGTSRSNITFLRELKADEKGAKQLKDIVNFGVSLGVGKPIDRQEFLKQLEASGKLATRQTPERIFAYYQAQMVEAGLLKVEPIAGEKPAAKETAPKGKAAAAKAPAAAATPATSAKAPAAAPPPGSAAVASGTKATAADQTKPVAG